MQRFFGNGRRSGRMSQHRKADNELVAAETRDTVACPQTTLQAPRREL